MKVKEAYKIIKPKYADKKLLECLEFNNFFAFLFAENDEETVGGGYDTVDKRTGNVSTFNPTEDFDSFFKAKQIPTQNLI